MFPRVFAALSRAAVVLLLVAMPGMMIPGVPSESTQFAAFIGVFLAILVYVEYASQTPIVIDFRDAPPFNRIRFGALFIVVFLLTALMRGATMTAPLGDFVYIIGNALGHLFDFPYSPIRLTVLMLPETTSIDTINVVRAAAGIGFTVCMLTVIAFVVTIRVTGWPGRGNRFNVLTNLPMFDPTAGGDVVERLAKQARINIALGFVAPFAIPAMIKLLSFMVDPLRFENMQSLVWLIALWTIVPASLYMRGIAMGRLVQMIERTRRKRYAEALEDGQAYA
ncbi:MAG: hypothetical protein ACWA40_08505 [Planktomarina sp.]